MSEEIARYNVLFEEIDRRVGVISEACAATDEKLERMDLRLRDVEKRMDVLDITANVLATRLERLTSTRRKK